MIRYLRKAASTQDENLAEGAAAPLRREDLPMKPSRMPLLLPLVYLAIAPLFLRRRMRLAHHVLVRARAEAVFPFINDLRQWIRWYPQPNGDGFHFSYSGPTTGVGATQLREHNGHGRTLEIVHVTPPEWVAYEIDMDHGRRHMEGVIALEARESVTRVRWILKWEGDQNPWLRYGDLLERLRRSRRMRCGLETLRRVVEEQVGRPRGPGGETLTR